MKKMMLLTVSAFVMAVSLGACAQNDTVQPISNEQKVQITADDDDTYGAKGALQDDAYTMEEMLTYALQDEYLAKYEYEQIIKSYGQITPFTNIVKAEAQHISELLPLFDAYGFDVPADVSAEYAVIPESLLEAGEIGVAAEIANIAMYDRFLQEDLPEDVRAVFEALRDASKKHLEAFKRLVRREQ